MSEDPTGRPDSAPSPILYTVKQLADAEPALGVGHVDAHVRAVPGDGVRGRPLELDQGQGIEQVVADADAGAALAEAAHPAHEQALAAEGLVVDEVQRLHRVGQSRGGIAHQRLDAGVAIHALSLR